MKKSKMDIVCAICGETRKYASKDKLVDEGWAIVQGNGAPHYFCPKESVTAQVGYISKMCIGLSGDRKTMKAIRAKWIVREQGQHSGREIAVKSQFGLLPKKPCAMCGDMHIEQELEVNAEEQLLCAVCMDKYINMREAIYYGYDREKFRRGY